MSYTQILTLLISAIAFSFLVSIPIITAEASPWPAFNVCCEKTNNNAWCINTLEENCDASFRMTPTSCEATSFCKPGCCYDSQEGLCMENTPQKVCNDAEGIFIDDAECNIPQCSLGCCVIGTQASFVTLTRCKKMSNDYGLKTNFRTDINDETTCIAVAGSQDQGACVYEIDFQRTCRFTTRGECLDSGSGGNQTSGAEFFKDYLCSAEELATNCGPSKKTTCVEGRDEVYYLDTCGNTANIYDSRKYEDDSYWTKRVDKSQTCGARRLDGNAKDRNCGNCDYFHGSICSDGSATYGDNVCQDLNCYNTIDGNDYKNGESWCLFDNNLIGQGKDTVGSRHFRHVCIFGEETIEPCADFRNEQCLQQDVETGGEKFTEAACRINRWVDCIDQKEEDDCLNTDKRDCYWREGYQFTGLERIGSGSSNTQTFQGGITGQAIFGGGDDEKETTQASGIQPGEGACLPDISPGLKFWESGEAESTCSLGNSVCVVEYEKSLTGKKECIENCECLKQDWRDEMNEMCVSLGDCGEYINFVGREGGENIDYKINGQRQATKSGSETFGSTRTGGFEGGLKSEKPIGIGMISDLFEKVGLATGVGLVSGDELGSTDAKPATAHYTTEEIGYTGPSTTKITGFEGILKGFKPITETIKGDEITKTLTADYSGSGNVKYLIDSESVTFTDANTLAKKASSSLVKNAEAFAAKDVLSTTELTIGDISSKSNPLSSKGFTLTKRIVDPNTGNINLELTDKAGNIHKFSGKESAQLSTLSTQAQTGGVGWTQGVMDFFGENIFDNLISAAGIGALGAMVGTFAGGEDGTKWGFVSGFAGSVSYQIAKSAVGKSGALFGQKWLTPGRFGLGVGIAIFILTYKKTSTEIIEFNCEPWQPPIGGSDCEACNDNDFKGCSEYRCKSLGQACGIINSGTEEEACTWINPHDVNSPKIKMIDVSENYIYKPDTSVRPPATGVYISKENGDFVEAFFPLEFTIETDEPSQCKIDYNLTTGFEEMSYYFGGDSLFDYNHTEKMSLPGPDAINTLAPELKNDGTYTLYVRCQDANGNFNQDAYSIRFKVQAGPDATAPRIEDLSVQSNMPVSYNTTSLDLEVYVNEPAQCKWSREDRTWENMENSMSCATNMWEMNNRNVYTCAVILTGIKDRVENDYYFRCSDVSEKLNVNTQSYKYTIIGTQPLNILSVGPNETIKGSTDTIPISLEVKTDNGYLDGKAFCYYSTTGIEEDYIMFAETDSNIHTQRQDLDTGSYTYYYKCVDLGGNAAYDSTSFNVEVDRTGPNVIRVYKEGDLKIITNEESICSYSIKDCNFNIEDGIAMPYDNEQVHTAEWKVNQKYYIRCKDEYDNQANPNTCSIIVNPYAVAENVMVL